MEIIVVGDKMKKILLFFILSLFLINPAFATVDKQPDFGPYMRELQHRVKKEWEPPKGAESKRVVTLFNIDRAGNITKIKVLTSGGRGCDDAAINAIQQTSPFLPLPDEFKDKSVDIQFTFDYNVFGKSDKRIPVNNTQKNQNLTNNDEEKKQIGNNQSIKTINYVKENTFYDKKAYKEYKKQIEKVVLQNLPEEKYSLKKTAEISVIIKKDGQAKNISILRSSGSKTFDTLILSSLKDCVFPKFPEILHTDEMTFSYQVSSAYGGNRTFIPIILPLYYPWLFGTGCRHY